MTTRAKAGGLASAGPGPSATKKRRIADVLDRLRAARPLAEEGRGLLLVDTLADRWEVQDRVPPGKTVLVEIDLPRWLSLVKRIPERRPPKRRGTGGAARPCTP